MRLLFLLSVAVATCWAADSALMARLRTTSFISVPGVEPILRPTMPGGGGSYIEMGDILKDFDDYYLYFHGNNLGGIGGYSIGVAHAKSRLGPWKFHESNPILHAEQPWEGGSVAGPEVTKRGVSGDVPAPPLRRSGIPVRSSNNGTYCPPNCPATAPLGSRRTL